MRSSVRFRRRAFRDDDHLAPEVVRAVDAEGLAGTGRVYESSTT
jgi:hypothetical protein